MLVAVVTAHALALAGLLAYAPARKVLVEAPGLRAPYHPRASTSTRATGTAAEATDRAGSPGGAADGGGEDGAAR